MNDATGRRGLRSRHDVLAQLGAASLHGYEMGFERAAPYLKAHAKLVRPS